MFVCVWGESCEGMSSCSPPPPASSAPSHLSCDVLEGHPGDSRTTTALTSGHGSGTPRWAHRLGPLSPPSLGGERWWWQEEHPQRLQRAVEIPGREVISDVPSQRPELSPLLLVHTSVDRRTSSRGDGCVYLY